MGIKKAVIYTRVSTQDQHPEMQQEELVEYVKRRGWTLYKEYSDKGISGAKERRPALDALLDDCRRKKVDVVVVWKFDCFARSLKQLLNDSEPACIRILDSKSAAGVRPVWLTNHCRQALVEWREVFGPEFSPFIFASPRNPSVHFVDYKTSWRTAAKKAGLAGRRIYDLRATFASRANVCHATGLTVAHLLGHASTQILPTYVRPFDENTRALIEAMDTARKNQRLGTGSIN